MSNIQHYLSILYIAADMLRQSGMGQEDIPARIIMEMAAEELLREGMPVESHGTSFRIVSDGWALTFTQSDGHCVLQSVTGPARDRHSIGGPDGTWDVRSSAHTRYSSSDASVHTRQKAESAQAMTSQDAETFGSHRSRIDNPKVPTDDEDVTDMDTASVTAKEQQRTNAAWQQTTEAKRETNDGILNMNQETRSGYNRDAPPDREAMKEGNGNGYGAACEENSAPLKKATEPIGEPDNGFNAVYEDDGGPEDIPMEPDGEPDEAPGNPAPIPDLSDPYSMPGSGGRQSASESSIPAAAAECGASSETGSGTRSDDERRITSTAPAPGQPVHSAPEPETPTSDRTHQPDNSLEVDAPEYFRQTIAEGAIRKHDIFLTALSLKLYRRCVAPENHITTLGFKLTPLDRQDAMVGRIPAVLGCYKWMHQYHVILTREGQPSVVDLDDMQLRLCPFISRNGSMEVRVEARSKTDYEIVCQATPTQLTGQTGHMILDGDGIRFHLMPITFHNDVYGLASVCVMAEPVTGSAQPVISTSPRDGHLIHLRCNDRLYEVDCRWDKRPERPDTDTLYAKAVRIGAGPRR